MREALWTNVVVCLAFVKEGNEFLLFPDHGQKNTGIKVTPNTVWLDSFFESMIEKTVHLKKKVKEC